jgi:hypothetical protein
VLRKIQGEPQRTIHAVDNLPRARRKRVETILGKVETFRRQPAAGDQRDAAIGDDQRKQTAEQYRASA